MTTKRIKDLATLSPLAGATFVPTDTNAGGTRKIAHNFAGAAAPTTADDSSAGYAPGSLWVYGTSLYFCTSATVGAAQWTQVIAGSLLTALTALFNAADTTLGGTPLGSAPHTLTVYGSTLILRSDNDIQVYGSGATQLYGLAEPGSDNAAATKKYVDRPLARDAGTASSDTLAYTDFGSVVRYARTSTVAITLPDLSANVTAGRAHTILCVFADAATNPTITPTGAGVKLNESTSAYAPGAAAGVVALTTFDGKRWYR